MMRLAWESFGSTSHSKQIKNANNKETGWQIAIPSLCCKLF